MDFWVARKKSGRQQGSFKKAISGGGKSPFDWGKIPTTAFENKNTL